MASDANSIRSAEMPLEVSFNNHAINASANDDTAPAHQKVYRSEQSKQIK